MGKGGVQNMYEATYVAKHIISVCNKHNIEISNLKLQKMLYFAWIEYYKQKNEKLFLNPICAWKLGPVVPDVYYDYCIYAGYPIPDVNFDAESSELKCLEKTILHFASMNVSKLVDITHEEGKPWTNIYKDGRGNRHEIPFNLIIDLECKEA